MPTSNSKRFVFAALAAAPVVAVGGWLLAGQSAIAEPAQQAQQAAQQTPAQDRLQTFITPQQLKDLQAQAGENFVIVDVRKPEEYAAGHIPGAINLPGKDLRTPKAKPGEGDSQYIFRTENGEPDIARYEQILSQAGISRDDTVVVYGNHAGKGDGTIPAMILDWLGQKKVYFLDGVGMSEWYEAGFQAEQQANTRPTAKYDAQPRENFVWNADDVKAHLGDENVILLDTRSIEEYVGTDKRSNAHGGHIPGAVRSDYVDYLNEDKTVKSLSEVQNELQEAGVTPEDSNKTIVLYCQTATRVSLPYLALRELGYENVVIYDASWHEWGNREDTPKATGEKPQATAK